MPSSTRRTELREFLMAHRARVSPAEAGLPAGGRRRTPGLRREEVAVLAGVGVSWYQWLEQGRDITVSPQVLDAVVRVLRLSPDERRHLYVLAGLNPPLRCGAELPIGADLIGILDGWLPQPAHLVDRYWNLIAANDAARAVLGYRRDDLGNCLVSFFTDPIYRSRFAAWEAVAPTVVAGYRYESSMHPGDAGFAAVVDELLPVSAEFRRLWARQEVRAPGILPKTLVHPEAGELSFDSSQLRLADRSDLSLVLHTPRPGTGTAERVVALVDDERRELRLVDAS